MTARQSIVGGLLLLIWAPLSTRSLPGQAPVGRLIGTVIVGDGSDTPIGGAIVVLSGPDLDSVRMTVTDEEGHYAFTNLPPGRVTVKAAKPPYLTMSYGAGRADRNGASIPIAADGSTPNIRIALPLGGVLTGQVIDDDGVSVPDVVVSARRPSFPAERALEAITDDRGVYRMYGLRSGDYVIAATLNVSGSGNIVRLTSADIDRMLAELEGPSGRIQTGARNATAGASVAFAPVYWPGTSDAEAAASIRVDAGSEVVGVNIVWRPMRAATVRGAVIVADAATLSRVRVELLTADRRLPVWGSGPSATFDRIDPTQFVIEAVPPGNYQLVARAQRADGPPGASDLFAVSEVRAGGSDIDGLALNLAAASRLRGVVTGATPEMLSSFRLRLAPERVRGSGSSMESPALTTLRPDGTFEIDGIPPGRYIIDLLAPNAFVGSLRSLVVQGRDSLDVPLIEVRTGETLDAELRLSPERFDLSGVLVRPDQAPAHEFDVVVFPTDVHLRRPLSRRIRSTRPGIDGVFEFRDLPPGKYLVAAVTDVRAEDLADSSFLAMLASGAAPAGLEAPGLVTLRLMTVR